MFAKHAKLRMIIIWIFEYGDQITRRVESRPQCRPQYLISFIAISEKIFRVHWWLCKNAPFQLLQEDTRCNERSSTKYGLGVYWNWTLFKRIFCFIFYPISYVGCPIPMINYQIRQLTTFHIIIIPPIRSFIFCNGFHLSLPCDIITSQRRGPRYRNMHTWDRRWSNLNCPGGAFDIDVRGG